MELVEKTTEETAPGPQIVAEIKLQAMSDGNVAITMPNGLNLWDLRGIIAKALSTACGLEIIIP